MLDQFEKGLFAAQLRPLLRLCHLYVIRRILPTMKRLFFYRNPPKSLVECLHQIKLEGVYLYLTAEELHLGNQFLYGEAEGGGQDGLEL